MRVYFDATEYETAHGKKPRGRGSWAFCFVVPPGYRVPAPDGDLAWFSPSLTYGEAKRWARAIARTLPELLDVAEDFDVDVEVLS